MAISPDGRRVYVTNSEDLSVSVIDVAVSPDGAHLYVTDFEADRIMIADAELGTLLGQVSVVPSPRSLALSASGDRLYVAGFNGGISVVDTGTRSVLQMIDTTQGVFRLALSKDGKRLFASDPFNANVLVVDLEQNQVVSVVPALSGGLSTRGLALSEDGRLIYVTNQDSKLFADFLVFAGIFGRGVGF
jgi:DNA-binding beta-propeller fold protein YncE